jgi:hypothetical protein
MVHGALYMVHGLCHKDHAPCSTKTFASPTKTVLEIGYKKSIMQKVFRLNYRGSLKANSTPV